MRIISSNSSRSFEMQLPCAGVLIFVSLAEHYARIVADDGIASKVDQSVWQDAIDTLLSWRGRRRDRGRLLLSRSRNAGTSCRAFSARAWGEDQLPDRIYLI